MKFELSVSLTSTFIDLPWLEYAPSPETLDYCELINVICETLELNGDGKFAMLLPDGSRVEMSLWYELPDILCELPQIINNLKGMRAFEIEFYQQGTEIDLQFKLHQHDVYQLEVQDRNTSEVSSHGKIGRMEILKNLYLLRDVFLKITEKLNLTPEQREVLLKNLV